MSAKFKKSGVGFKKAGKSVLKLSDKNLCMNPSASDIHENALLTENVVEMTAGSVRIVEGDIPIG